MREKKDNNDEKVIYKMKLETTNRRKEKWNKCQEFAR